MSARVAVVQFPGVNCEVESIRALARAGIAAEVFRATRPARELARFDGFLLPGGFSFQDRVRAGALAAKDALLDALAAEAARGRPVLGICNGAQVLVEAGLVPGRGTVELALARNRMPGRSGYYTRWVYCRVEASACAFTAHLLPGMVLPLPVAHGEGRFTSASPRAIASLVRRGQAPLRYCDAAGAVVRRFPANPNGAESAVAAVCNEGGNVLAMMPHPERVLDLAAIGRDVAGEWGRRRDAALEGLGESPFADAPGLALFHGFAHALEAV